MDYNTERNLLYASLEDVKVQQLKEEGRQRVLAKLSEILDSMEDSKHFLSEQEKKFALLRIEGNETPEKSALNTLDTSEALEQYTFFIDPSGSVTETETEQLEQPKPKKRAPEEAAAVLVDSGYYDSLLLPKEYITTEHKIEELLTTAETAEDFEKIIKLLSEQQARIKDATDRLIEDIKQYGSGKYVFTRQNELTNEFRELRSKKKSPKTRRGEVELITKHVIAHLSDPELNAPLGTTAQKLMDLAVIKYEETGNRIIEIPMKEFMAIRGIGKSAAYAQADEDALTLMSTVIRYVSSDPQKEHPGFPTNNYIHLVSKIETSVGKIVVRIDPEYEVLLKAHGTHKARINTDVFKLNRPGAYSMIFWALTYKHTNYADPNPKKQDRIRVKTLLDHAAWEIPSYEEVMKTDRHHYKRIRTPFVTALNEAEDHGILKWHYTDKDRKNVSWAKAEALPFLEWQDLFVEFEWNQHPNDTDEEKAKAAAIVERRQEKKAKRLADGPKKKKTSKK